MRRERKRSQGKGEQQDKNRGGEDGSNSPADGQENGRTGGQAVNKAAVGEEAEEAELLAL